MHTLDALESRVRMRQRARIKEGCSRLGRFLRKLLNPAAREQVSASIADSALHQMLFSGGVLNKRLVGGEAIEGSTDFRATYSVNRSPGGGRNDNITKRRRSISYDSVG